MAKRAVKRGMRTERQEKNYLFCLFFFFLVLFVFGFALFRRGTLGKINFETENVQGLEF